MAPRQRRERKDAGRPAERAGRLAKLTAGEARTRRQVAALVADHIELARKIAKIRAAGLPSLVVFDDVFSDAMKGLWEAAERFQPARGVAFTTYAEWRIGGAIHDGLRKRDWLPRGKRKAYKGRGEDAPAMMSLSTIVTRGDDGDPVELGDGLPAVRVGPAEQRFAGKIVREHFQWFCRDVGPKSRLILTLYYVDGLPMAAIGHIVGLSESRISQIHSAAIIRLRRLRDVPVGRMKTDTQHPKGSTP